MLFKIFLCGVVFGSIITWIAMFIRQTIIDINQERRRLYDLENEIDKEE